MDKVGEIRFIIVDANPGNKEKTVEFYSALLGRRAVETSPPYTDIGPKQGDITVSVQQVKDEENSAGIHFDIVVDDLDFAIKQARELGGELVELKREKGYEWAVMHDPSGNIFCFVTE